MTELWKCTNGHVHATESTAAGCYRAGKPAPFTSDGPRPTVVELVSTTDHYTRLRPGDLGLLEKSDAYTGAAHVLWFDGHRLTLLRGEDSWRERIATERVALGLFIDGENVDPTYWTCLCGNIAEDSGFTPCDLAGRYTEPTRAGWPIALYRCDACGRIVLATLESWGAEDLAPNADGWIVGRVAGTDLVTEPASEVFARVRRALDAADEALEGGKDR